MPRALARRRVDAGIVDCVLADERFGVTEYCIGLGHRDILHVPTALTPPHHGHREAMLGTGRSSSRPTCPSRAAEPRIRERLESGSRFTAVFTHNDLAALDGL